MSPTDPTGVPATFTALPLTTWLAVTKSALTL